MSRKEKQEQKENLPRAAQAQHAILTGGSVDKFAYFLPENQPSASIPQRSEGDKSDQK